MCHVLLLLEGRSKSLSEPGVSFSESMTSVLHCALSSVSEQINEDVDDDKNLPCRPYLHYHQCRVDV